MGIFDISVPIGPGTVTYPGDPTVHLSRHARRRAGALHRRRSWHRRASARRARRPAQVIDATAVHGRIDADTPVDLERAERIVFKTSNSQLWERATFVDTFVTLSEEGAHVLIETGARLVGIDYLSIGDENVHRALLRAGVVILEGLDLRGVAPGRYELTCAPLKLVGADGAPARVFLRHRLDDGLR